ncbi:hypothetical protein PG990_002444 [Apiospora arundinis]
MKLRVQTSSSRALAIAARSPVAVAPSLRGAGAAALGADGRFPELLAQSKALQECARGGGVGQHLLAGATSRAAERSDALNHLLGLALLLMIGNGLIVARSSGSARAVMVVASRLTRVVAISEAVATSIAAPVPVVAIAVGALAVQLCLLLSRDGGSTGRDGVLGQVGPDPLDGLLGQGLLGVIGGRVTAAVGNAVVLQFDRGIVKAIVAHPFRKLGG